MDSLNSWSITVSAGLSIRWTCRDVEVVTELLLKTSDSLQPKLVVPLQGYDWILCGESREKVFKIRDSTCSSLIYNFSENFSILRKILPFSISVLTLANICKIEYLPKIPNTTKITQNLTIPYFSQQLSRQDPKFPKIVKSISTYSSFHSIVVWGSRTRASHCSTTLLSTCATHSH